MLGLGSHDKLRNHGLHKAGWLLGGGFCDAKNPLAQGGLRGNPAEAASWGNCLGESIEADNTAFGIHRKIGRNEGIEEGEAGRVGGVVIVFARSSVGRCRNAASSEGRGVGGWILQVPIWVVLNNDDIVFAAKGIDVFATLNAQRTRCGILPDTA